MTEAEWLAGRVTGPMALVALATPRASDRVCRLFVAAFWSWQAAQKPDARADLRARAAAVEVWAETGRLPAPYRRSRSRDVVFFNSDARRMVEVTTGAPEHVSWGAEGPGATVRQVQLFRDIFGNPFRPVAVAPEWRTDTVLAIGRQMYEGRDFSAMPILADALQDAGCDVDDILAHCRDSCEHVRGCWVVDLILGKA
jgi:hypothetical protein